MKICLEMKNKELMVRYLDIENMRKIMKEELLPGGGDARTLAGIV